MPEGEEWRRVRNRQRNQSLVCGALGRLIVAQNESGSEWIFVRFSGISLRKGVRLGIFVESGSYYEIKFNSGLY